MFRVALCVGIALSVFGCVSHRNSPIPGPASEPLLLSDARFALKAWEEGDPARSVLVTDGALLASIQRLESRSPSFRAGWLRVRSSGIPLIIGTAEQIGEVLPGDYRVQSQWAAVVWPTPYASRTIPLRRVAVVIEMERLTALNARLRLDSAAAQYGLDLIVAHEIWGHVVPIIIDGYSRPGCPDPVAFSPPEVARSCIGQRMKIIEAELEPYRAALVDSLAHLRAERGRR